MFHGGAGPNYCNKLRGQNEDKRVALHWRTNLMTLLTFLAPLALIGLVHGGLENGSDCYVIGNSFTNAWQLHAPVPLLLV